MYVHSYSSVKIAVGVIVFFLGINFYFNFPLWNQVLQDDSQTLSYHGELLLLHLSGETVYQNILHGVNPYTTNSQLMYPFGANYAINDLAPINGYYFLILRPFFSIHQSISLIAAVSILLSHLCMYLFLRRLSLSRAVSLIMATSFGFTPLLAARMGAQVTYDSLFPFPLIGIFLHIIVTNSRSWSKLGAALGLGITGAILVLSNLNYTIILGLLLVLYLFIYLLLHPATIFVLVKKNLLYLIASGTVFTVLLTPWIKQTLELVKTTGVPHGSSAGIIEYSGHLLGFFIPSQWNNFYQPLMNKLYTISPYMATQSEGFVYPGMVIIGSIVLYLFFRSSLPLKLRKTALPHLLVALTGGLIALGPYLHLGSHYIFSIFNHTFSIPLPFILVQKIPFLNNFRSPGRLALVLVVAGTIFTAYYLHYLFRRIKTPVLYSIITVLILTIVLIDQNFMHVKALPQTIPSGIYSELSQDEQLGTVMEIPFTLRDGLQYMGSLDSIFYQLGTFTYKHSVIGTHIGRINQYVLDYYRRNAFIGYIGQLIDSDKVHAKLFDPLGVYTGSPFNVQAAEEAVNYLDLDAVILKTNEPYSQQIVQILLSIGYRPSTIDQNFTLYRRYSPDMNKLCVPFGESDESLYLARGWDDTPSDDPKRWVIGRRASFFIKAERDLQLDNLSFTLHSLTPNQLEVTVGETSATIVLQAGEHTYEVPLTASVKRGLTPIYLTFTRATAPSSIIPGSIDGRQLSGYFSHLCASL